MEDSYSVSLGLRECGEAIHAAVTDSVTGELVDHYELTHPGGGTCVVAVYEKHYYRAGNRLTLTVVLDDFTGRTRVHCISGGGGAKLRITLSVDKIIKTEGVVHDALSHYRL